MDRTAQDLWHSLPNKTYLDFIARYLLQRSIDQPPVDPFALNVTGNTVKQVYVPREEVESEIALPGTRVIIGAEGSGKTTLLKTLPAFLSKRDRTLVVQLPLTQIGLSAPEDEWMGGRVSLLTPEILVRYIFDAYWEDLARHPFHRVRFLPSLRQHDWWMARLHWFYQYYRPLNAEIFADTQLMGRLSASPPGLDVSQTPQGALQELLQFVTFAFPRQDRPNTPPTPLYTKIHLLIGGTEPLSRQAIIRLIQDARRLHDLYSSCLQVSVFANSSWRETIQTMGSVQQGSVALYCLPQWDMTSLREILDRRLVVWRPGEFAAPDWGKLIPQAALEAIAQRKLTETVVEAARKTYEQGNDLDAPVHALRLARGLLAACAGCWSQYGYTPPLNYRQIRELADLYWKAAKSTIPLIGTSLEGKAREPEQLARSILPTEQLPKVNAIVRVDRERDRPICPGDSFTVQAGIEEQLPESCDDDFVSVSGPEKNIQFDIVMRAEDMEILPTRRMSYVFCRHELPPLVEFELKPMKSGSKQIRAEFFYRQHWLAKIQFDVKVLKASHSLPPDRSENCR